MRVFQELKKREKEIEDLSEAMKKIKKMEGEGKEKNILKSLTDTFECWKKGQEILEAILQDKIYAQKKQNNKKQKELELLEIVLKEIIQEVEQIVEQQLNNEIKRLKQKLDIRQNHANKINDNISMVLQSNLDLLSNIKQETGKEIFAQLQQTSSIIQSKQQQTLNISVKSPDQEVITTLSEQGQQSQSSKSKTEDREWELPSLQFEKEMKWYFRKHKIEAVFREQVSFVAAMLFITFIVTVDVQRNSSRAFHVPVITYIVEKIESLNYGRFDIDKDEKEAPYQVGNLIYYYEPTWLPDGFKLIQEFKKNTLNNITYSNETEEYYIIYTQEVVVIERDYNLESLQSDEIIAGKHIYYYTSLVTDNTPQRYLFWYEGIYKFQLASNLSKEELMKLGDSVKLKEKAIIQ